MCFLNKLVWKHQSHMWTNINLKIQNLWHRAQTFTGKQMSACVWALVFALLGDTG